MAEDTVTEQHGDFIERPGEEKQTRAACPGKEDRSWARAAAEVQGSRGRRPRAHLVGEDPQVRTLTAKSPVWI